MLIINGSAEFMSEKGEHIIGNRYAFNMFVKNDNLNEQLNDIEKYLIDRDWDNIEITDNGLIENIADIEHTVLIEAFKKAQNEGISVVVNNSITMTFNANGVCGTGTHDAVKVKAVNIRSGSRYNIHCYSTRYTQSIKRIAKG